jgi:hypothetical protein
VLADIMPGWKVHQIVAAVLRVAGLDFSQVAFVNLLSGAPGPAAALPGCMNSVATTTRVNS